MRGLRKPLIAVIATVLVMGGIVVASTGVGALATNGFEINDGNIVDNNPPAAIHDWGTAFNADGSSNTANLPPGTAGASFNNDGLANDPLPVSVCPQAKANDKGDTTVFGATSDANGDPIPTYTFKAGSIPSNKDDLSNVYAIAAPDPNNGHLIIYFGLERVDNNGDSHIDFEFLKAGESLVPSGTDANGCPTGDFDGSRTIGDFLISVDYTNGGGFPTASFRRWDGTQYVQQTPAAGAMGIFPNTGPIACGPWVCRDTNENATTTLDTNTFAEGWIDTGDPAVDFTGCISSLNAHTRSAQSFTSQLKDFALLNFHTCDAKISIGNDGTNIVGQPHTVTGHVDVNPGGGFVNAPAGTTINFAIASGPGTLTAPSCTTIGTTGSCSVTLNSSVPGVTVVNATSSPVVNGSTLTRTTNGQDGNSGPLTKTWVDARVSVGPTGVNEVNHKHTITGHVDVNDGSGWANAPDGTEIDFTASDGTLSASSCFTSGSTGSCTVDLNSSTPGVITVNASTTVLVSGKSISRTTDSTHGSSGPMTKTYVDARIHVAQDGTNEINHSHNVTGFLEINDGTNGWVPAPNGVTISYAVASGPGSLTPSSCLTAGGTGKCTVSLNSSTAGITKVNASATVSVLGVSMTRTTDSTGGNGGPLTKTWVDANIQVGTTATNVVTDPHTVTGHVNVNPGTGFVNAPNGTVINFQIVSGPGNLSASSCVVAGGTGSCSVTLNSAVAGVTTVNATTNVTVGGVSLHRETDGNGLNSGPMVKTYVDAKIAITPNGVNEINHAHQFTGHVDVNPGTGFVNAPDGTTITFNVVSGPGALTPTSCQTTGGTGSCTTSLNSSIPGVTQVGAATTVTVGGLPVSRTTNGSSGNSGPATKTWVDANIQVGIDGTNEIGHAHTVTGHVNVNDGTGYANAPVGTLITFSIASGPGTLTPASCMTVTNTGTCSVSLNSSTTGVTKVNASTSVSILGVTVSRTTDGTGSNSGPLTKTWVNAKITIGNDGTNAVGSPHTVTGHVFVDTGTGSFVDAPDGTVINFQIDSGPGNLSAPSCTVSNGLGTCSVTLNSSVTGVTKVSASSTPLVGGVPVSRSTDGVAPNSGPLTKTWVNAGISVGNDGTNEVGDPHTVTGHVTVDPGSGPIDAPNGTVINFAIDSGPGNLSAPSCTVNNGLGSCSVSLNSSVAGVTKVSASSTLSVGGVSFTLNTDGLAGNSGPLTKTWVDARIHVGNDGTNKVGDPHTVTGHVEVNDGSGWTDAGDGTEIDFNIASGPGDLSAPSCTTSGGGGTCSVTLTSNVAGITKVDASTDVTVGGLGLHRTTDGLAGNGGPLTKTWVDANIAIAKNGTNEVGDPHTFTGHVNVNDGSGFVNAPAGTEIDFSIVSGPGNLSAASCLTIGATGECSVDLNSDDPGVTDVHAATDVVVSGLTLHRETDGTHGSSEDAFKTYVDARISITPGEATNEVNHKHTFTGYVEVNDGSGWADAADGLEIDFAITGGPGSLSAPSCLTTGGGGTCSVDLNSTVPGVTTLSASSDPVVGGLTLHRTTDGLAGNSDPATKTWVDARIHVGNDGVNEVGNKHTVTGHVEINDGTNGWVDATDGTEIDFNIESGPGSLSAASCLTSGGGGTCSVDLNSSTTGVTDVSATTTVTVGGQSMTRTTDGLAGNGEDLSKTWVDGWITVTPLTATNGIGEPHTITAHVTADNGGVESPAPDGTTVQFSLSNNTAGAAFVGGVDSCTTTGGDCSVQINTTTAGGVDIHASTTFSVGGVSITRETDGTGNNSVDAHKDYLAGTLTWEKRALSTTGALLGGATFQVCRTFTWNSATSSLVDNNPDVCQTVADDTDGVAGPGPDMDPAAGKFKLTDLVLGRYTVKETVAPAGYVLDTHTYTTDVTPANLNGSIGTPFVDTKAGQCSRTLGFWMNHPQYWDQAGDLTASHAGFITSTAFPWTTGSMAGKTYLQILQSSVSGDLSIQVARQYIAAVLNTAAFGGDPNINGLILQAQDYFDGLSGQPGSTADNADPDSVDQFTQPVGSNPTGQAKNAASALIGALDLYNSGNETFCSPGQNPPS